MYPKILRFAIWSLFKILGGIMHPICWLISYERPSKRYCPKIQNPNLLLSATKLAELIRLKKLTCEEVVRMYIHRVQAVNDVLNAVVQNRFEEAITEAKEMDQAYSNNQYTYEELKTSKPLFGIPVTIKESISVAAMSNKAGCVDEKNYMALKNARVVELIIEAGAIPILVSNTPELCVNWESYNKVTGLTKNPFNCSKTPGGSSGGESALLGSAASVIGIGSDIGGSLRLPAMFTQVFGHKPSPRIVSVQGHYPDSADENWPEVFVIGPMTRYAEDLPIVLNAICEPVFRSKLNLHEMVPMNNIKFYYMENDANSYITNSVNKDIVEAIRKFVQYLEAKYNIKAEKINIEELQYAAEICLFVLMGIKNVDNIFSDKNANTKNKVSSVIFKYLTFRSKSVLMPILYGIAQKSVQILTLDDKIKACNHILEKISDKFQTFLGQNGVFLYPTFPSSAHYHYEIFHKLADCSYMAIFNVLGMPVTNCPVGLDSNKMPIGIQVISNRDQDRLTLSVAQEIEQIFGGWSAPPSL